MRKLVTGLDEQGRSCVVEEKELALVGDDDRPGRPRAVLWRTHESPPPARPDGHGELIDLGVGTGHVLWQIIRFEPGVELPMHHTDTLDFDHVLEGSVELVLDDGAHQLGPGDCVVMTGVDHAWRTGPDGVLMSITLVGSTPKEG